MPDGIILGGLPGWCPMRSSRRGRRDGIAARNADAGHLSGGDEPGDESMKRRIGDRRGKPRFEIVGDLWGSIDTTTSIDVQNLGRGGALLESPLPLTQDSVHWVTALADGEPHMVQIRVCHSRPAPGKAGAARFLIGVEFVRLSPAVEDAIARAMQLGNGRAAEA